MSPDQIEAYKEAISAYTNADRIVTAALSDPEAKTLPDELATYADPEGDWTETQATMLTAYRDWGWRTSGNPTVLAVPSAKGKDTANQVSLYVCVDSRQVKTSDAAGKAVGQGRITNGEIRVAQQDSKWRVTSTGKFTETKQCGQGEV